METDTVEYSAALLRLAECLPELEAKWLEWVDENYTEQHVLKAAKESNGN